MSAPRRGAVLLVVSGIAAILAAMTFAFLARMRADAEAGAEVLRDTQARVMLAAALQYIAEGSRLGWHTPGATAPEEAFGWIDVRDGRPGPRNQLGVPMFVGDPATGVGPAFPAVADPDSAVPYRAARCPMYVPVRPPYAIAPAPPNPIPQDPAREWKDLISYRVPYPQPADAATFALGDPRPRPESVGLSWFRVLRTAKGAQHRLATFIVTCGAGPTLGFRDWNEVLDWDLRTGDTMARAFVSRQFFDELRQGERVLWYETEWTSAVGGSTMYYNIDGSWVLNELGSPMMGGGGSGADNANSRQQAGCFLYIQRLADEPAAW